MPFALRWRLGTDVKNEALKKRLPSKKIGSFPYISRSFFILSSMFGWVEKRLSPPERGLAK